MEIQINSVNIKYKDKELDGAEVHINLKNDDYSLNLGGYIPLTVEQYQGNESLDKLESQVRLALIDKLKI